MKVLLSILLSLMYASAFSQQRPDPLVPQGENLQVPENWVVRLDHPGDEITIGANPDSADIYFVNMTPGWHITTGPAGIFYHPANTISGDYKLEATIYYFNPGERNREAYGVFFGGQNLDAENQQYNYFLIRNTGDFLVKQRSGNETSVIKDWTPTEAVVKYENPEESSVKNVFTVEVSGNQIICSLNGAQLYTGDASGLTTDGIFGLRINHSINVHIADLKVTQQ